MRIRACLLALAASVFVAACGGGSAPAPPPGPVPKPAGSSPTLDPSAGSVELDGSPTLEKIRRQGHITIGVRSDDRRFIARGRGGEYTGFDKEIARLLAAGLGVNPDTQLTLRWMPAASRLNSVVSGDVDLLLGGFDPAARDIARAGPYVITGPPGAEKQHFIGFKPGDDHLREEIQRVVDAGIANGSWQRIYDATLGQQRVSGRVPR